jgi:hypothetical protein
MMSAPAIRARAVIDPLAPRIITSFRWT